MPVRPSHRPVRRLLAGTVISAMGLLAPAVLAPAAHAATASDLLISEYVEGSSNNKALEIFNGTGAPVDLAAGGYSVQIFSNGAATAGSTINLTGTLAAGDAFVLANTSANATILAAADQTSGSLTFNGDDAVTLRKGSTVLDAFGQIGFDPGTEWGTGLASTADNTLRRKATICTGRTDGTTAFDPSAEWDGFATDTFDGLGSHSATCTPPAEEAPTVTSITPANGATGVGINTAVSVSFSEAVTVAAGGISLLCDGTPVAATLSGSGTAYTLTPDANLATGASCTATVSAAAVSDVDTNDPPDTLAADVTTSFTVVASDPCTLPYTRIGEIQGSGASAALTGTRTTQGVVVGDYEGASPNLRGFYLQDPDGDGDAATSDGIFVFNGSNLDSVSLGDVVRVTGNAGENQGQTQISVSSTNILKCGTGTVAPVDISLPFASADAPEAYEGMLVRFPQELSVTEHFQLGRFGQVVLSSGGRLKQPTNVVAPGPDAVAMQAANNLNRIIVDDATQAQNPDPIVFARGGQPLSASNTLRGGDTATGAMGVLSYTWGGNSASPNAYRLRPLQALGGGIDFVAANPRPTSAPAVGGTVKVAGMNLLNYFNTFGTTACTGGVGGMTMECRGADNQVEFDRQSAKTVAAILTLDADVIGVNEMENDGYGPTSALADLVGRLNAATADGTYAYVDVDAGTGQVNALGTDAIKVGMLYKPGVVTPTGTTAALNTDAFVNGGDTTARNRPSLAQAWQVNETGAVFIADINHLKSKGSACETPDLLDGQGNCAIVRTNAARALTEWLASDPTGTGDPDVVLLGDYNSYAKERPIQVIEEAGYTNLINRFLGDDAYSYVFDGQWGYLDHAFGSASLGSQVTGAAEFHINADEPSVLDYNTNFKTAFQIDSLYAPDMFRVSDHDPVLVGLNPNAAPSVDAGGPYAVDEGGSLALTASGSDPNAGDELAYAWDLDGDGTFETDGRTVNFDASGLDGPTTANVSVRVTDAGGLSSTASVSVAVRNVAPSVTASFSSALLECGTTASLTVTFTDPAPADTHTAVIAWGDGTSSTVTSATSPLTVTHSYAHSGSYAASVSVTDDDGGVGSAAASVAQAYATTGLRPPLRPGTNVVVKSGSTVPVKIAYADCSGAPPTAIAPVATVIYNGTVVATGTLVNKAGVWQWNLKTGSLPTKTGTYTVTVTVPSTGQTDSATFTLRR